ncbi:MAG: gamma-glutamyltransferase, partial [Cytophagales bacterium]|nr:gamma-glutamyltransferase [Cytophagales bacterium]
SVIDHGMTMQQAVNAKKFHSQWLPDQIVMEENAFPEETVRALEARGHRVKFTKQLGKMDAVLVREDGSLEGASDVTRTDGGPSGFDYKVFAGQKSFRSHGAKAFLILLDLKFSFLY